jgi:hypothetical protein
VREAREAIVSFFSDSQRRIEWLETHNRIFREANDGHAQRISEWCEALGVESGAEVADAVATLKLHAQRSFTAAAAESDECAKVREYAGHVTGAVRRVVTVFRAFQSEVEAGRDDNGSLGPKDPLSWQSMALAGSDLIADAVFALGAALAKNPRGGIEPRVEERNLDSRTSTGAADGAIPSPRSSLTETGRSTETYPEAIKRAIDTGETVTLTPEQGRQLYADIRAERLQSGTKPPGWDEAIAAAAKWFDQRGHPVLADALADDLCYGECHQVVRNIDAFQWTGDLDAFANWFGERMPIDFRNRISVPVHKSQEGKWLGPWLGVWCGNWIIRHEGRCECVTDIVFRNFIAPHYENVAGDKS